MQKIIKKVKGSGRANEGNIMIAI